MACTDFGIPSSPFGTQLMNGFKGCDEIYLYNIYFRPKYI